MQHFPEAFPTREFLIVHAVIAPYGYDMAHAWVEVTLKKQAVFIGIVEGGERVKFAADIDEFYADMKVQHTVKYTPLEAYLVEKKTAHYGPWDIRVCEVLNKPAVKIKTMETANG